MERAKGIEPSSVAWEATALPLSYARAAPAWYRAARKFGIRWPYHRAGMRNGYNADMQITLNGSPRQCAGATTISRLLEDTGFAGRRVAVEVNREIVPRSRHGEHVLDEGDRVEIVHAIGGG